MFSASFYSQKRVDPIHRIRFAYTGIVKALCLCEYTLV